MCAVILPPYATGVKTSGRAEYPVRGVMHHERCGQTGENPGDGNKKWPEI